MELKGIAVEIYEGKINGGDSDCMFKDTSAAILIHPAVSRTVKAYKTFPPVVIVEKNTVEGKKIIAYPADKNGQPMKRGLFGDSFIWSADSEFLKISRQPVPLFDRFRK